MGFQTEFNSVCKFKSEQELYELLEYGRGKMLKDGLRVFPTGQKVIAYTPDNQAVAIVLITACVSEINFQGREVTSVELQLIRKLTEEEARIQTALAHEMFLEIMHDCSFRLCSHVHGCAECFSFQDDDHEEFYEAE